MGYYPVLLDMNGQSVLVVGAGEVAERKIYSLLDCGAKISLISKMLNRNINKMVEENKITYLGARFEPKYLDNAFLVIAATDDPALNTQIASEAKKRGILVNAVDQPADCTFIVPSVVKRGDLIISISTSGKSPALSKKLRKSLENQFGSEYEKFLELMGQIRVLVLSMGREQKENSKIFNQIVNSDMLEAIKTGNLEKARSILRDILPEAIYHEIDLDEFMKTEG